MDNKDNKIPENSDSPTSGPVNNKKESHASGHRPQTSPIPGKGADKNKKHKEKKEQEISSKKDKVDIPASTETIEQKKEEKEEAKKKMPEPKSTAAPGEKKEIIDKEPPKGETPAKKVDIPIEEIIAAEPQIEEKETEVIEPSTQPPPGGKDEFLGEPELASLKTLKQNDVEDFKDEALKNQALEENFNRIKVMSDRLPEAVENLEKDFQQVMDETKQKYKNNAVPGELKENLDNRQESLELCLKMLKRLDRLFPRFKDIEEKVINVPGLKTFEWDEKVGQEKIKKADFNRLSAQLKETIENIRNHNYHILRQKREFVDELKKFFFEFFQRHFFPIIDGLDRGKEFYKENQGEWIEKFGDHVEIIDAHLRLYDALIDQFTKSLKEFHIIEIPLKEGEEFDEKIHEAFMVEEDEKLETNQILIKEINHKGYKFIDPKEKNEYIIRSPQVIVVKKRNLEVIEDAG